MADQFGSIANAGAYMMQSGLRAITERREQDMKQQMAMARLEAANARSASGGGKDPLSKGAMAFTGMRDMLNQYSDEQISLNKRLNELSAVNTPLGPGDQEELARVRSRLANNELSLKMLTSQFGDGKFEVTRTQPDGSTVKANFSTAAAYEAWNSTFGGAAQSQDQAAQTNESLLTKIFGGQRTGQGPQASAPQAAPSMPNYADELGRTKKRGDDMPEGFTESESEVASDKGETEQLKKELARLQMTREAEAKNTSFRPNVVVGAPGVGMATQAKARPSDKTRARIVRNLDKEIEALKKRIEAREE